MVESYKNSPTVYRVEGIAMEQDFTKGLNVCIGNYGYYNEGSLHDAWITLPKTEAEIRDFLHLNHLQDPQHEEIYISDYDGIPFGTRLLFNEFCHLEDLNLLAKQLVTANPADLEKVGAWIQANDTPESLVGLMNLIEQADDIPFYSWGYDGAYDKDEFGSMIYTTMSPEKNYGHEMVELNEELKHTSTVRVRLKAPLTMKNTGGLTPKVVKSPFLRTAISITALTDRTKIIMTVTSWFPLSATVMTQSIL